MYMKEVSSIDWVFIRGRGGSLKIRFVVRTSAMVVMNDVIEEALPSIDGLFML